MTRDQRRRALLELIAAQVTLVMAQRALKQYVTADDAQISTTTIKRICTGHDHHISRLSDLAEAMGCDLVIEIRPRVA